MTLKEINTRLKAIEQEVDKPDADVDSLNREIDELIAERNALQTAAIKERTRIAEMDDSAFLPAVRSSKTMLAEVDEDRTNSYEYRKAFMEFVQRGKFSDILRRADENTNTSDVSALIPTTIMNEIVQKMESYGELWSRVRKLNVQGGVAFPILSIKPTATWVGEGASETKKITANTSVMFSYYTLECKIAQSLVASVTTLTQFQAIFAQIATEAIIQSLEKGICKGTGTNQILGVENDVRVPGSQKIKLKETDFDWKTLKTKVMGKIKKSYRNGCFIMNQSTFDGYIDGMVDNNKQPIARCNYGIDGSETYRLFGKEVITVEDDVIASWDDAIDGETIAIYLNPNDYAINSNMQLNVVKWVDNDTNQVKNKAQIICDGKLIDPNGVLIILADKSTTP